MRIVSDVVTEVKNKYGVKGRLAFHKAVGRELKKKPEVEIGDDGQRVVSESFLSRWERNYRQRNGTMLSKRARISLPEKVLTDLGEKMSAVGAKNIKDLLYKIATGKVMVSMEGVKNDG